MADAHLNALVTGGSRGIGAAIARALAARGVRVAVHGRTPSAAGAALIGALPGSGHAWVAGDLATPEGAAKTWSAAEAALGRIDLLINNAGIYETHPPHSTSAAAWGEAWDRTLTTNLIGPARLAHAAVQAMLRADPQPGFGRGRIVNISSRGAFRGEPEAPAYGASKAGLNALGQSLARALAGDAIYVYTIAPGWVSTDMAADHLAGPDGPAILAQHPLGRVTTPDEVANATVFCALDAPAAMTGAILDVNGASYLRT